MLKHVDSAKDYHVLTCPMTSSTWALIEYISVLKFGKTLHICIMPKVTYPRPCPTCGKEFNKSMFFHHKKQCGTTEFRYQCSFCPLSFSRKYNMQWHIQQQHSKNPQRFTCPKCNQVFTRKERMKTHLETVCAEVKPATNVCSATHHLQDKTTGKDTCDVFTGISVVSKTSICFFICNI